MQRRINFIVIIACLVVLCACNENKNMYVLKGTVPIGIENGAIVFMTDYNDSQIVDSAKVFNGKFVFRGEADSAMARLLTLRELQADIIIDKGTMTIDMSDPYSATGNVMTEKLNEFYQTCGEIIILTKSKLAEIDESLSDEERGKMEDAVFETFFEELDAVHQFYLTEHPNDVLGAMIFYTWLQNQFDLTYEQFVEASQDAGEFILNFGPVKEMAAFLGRMEKTAVGMPFIDFTVAYGNRDGSSVSFSDYIGKGKYVLVDFWASWCMPCRMEAPVIAEVYKKYKGDRFEVLGVAVMDKRIETVKAIDDDGYTWPQIYDAQAEPLELYGIQGIPHIILFGPDGTILARNLRGEDIKNKVAEVLKK